jgi:hypothetical protein
MFPNVFTFPPVSVTKLCPMHDMYEHGNHSTYNESLCLVKRASANPYLRVVFTMDHEVIPRPCKICDWLLNSS